MLFYYIRHGEPIYEPDMLTEHGHVQAEAVKERLKNSGLSKIYSSTSVRARQTAEPTCKALGIEPVLLQFAHEYLCWVELTLLNEDKIGRRWLFEHQEACELFCSREIRELGDRWYEHPYFEGYDFKGAIERIYRESDAFFASLGYEHDRYTGKYVIKEKNDDRIALFAHQGFGLAFLSCVLDIPYPQFCTHFDMCHTGVTVIDFSDNGNGICIPKVLTLSSDSHLYAKGMESNYGLI